MLAKAKQSEGQPTLFDKILDKSVPSEMVYETEHVYCFRDIAPQAPTHVLCIPKVRDALTGLKMAESSTHGEFGRRLSNCCE
jgi:diadenosine tetraphosphate (Ap4A) HIT family hydrolase